MNPLAVTQINPDGLYQTMEIAKIVGVDYTTVYRWLRSGKLDFNIRRANNRPIVKGRNLIRFLNAKYL